LGFRFHKILIMHNLKINKVKNLNILFNHTLLVETNNNIFFNNLGNFSKRLQIKLINDWQFDSFINLINFIKFSSFYRFNYLTDLFGLDCLGLSLYASRLNRYNIYYNFLSIENGRLLISLNCNGRAPSLVNVFESSNWLEREVWDMFGISFTEDKHIRRILSDYGFRGFPLKKDYPLVGFKEVNYDSEKLNVIYTDLSLQQEYRKFDIISPWRKFRVLDKILY